MGSKATGFVAGSVDADQTGATRRTDRLSIKILDAGVTPGVGWSDILRYVPRRKFVGKMGGRVYLLE